MAVKVPAPLGSAERSKELQALGYAPEPPEHIREAIERAGPWAHAPHVVYCHEQRRITSAGRGGSDEGYRTLPRPSEAWACLEGHWKRLN